MKGCSDCLHMTRRSFLRKTAAGLSAYSLANPILGSVASTFAQTPGGTGNLLVLCQLNGGMDGLSFLAPFQNPIYQSNRPMLALSEENVTPLANAPEYGINNLFPYFSELYAQNQLAIVPQVGYPDANGSHFESQEVYEFGVRNLSSTAGTSASWYERLRRNYFDEPFGVLDTRSIGDPARYGYPDTTYRRASQDAFGRLARLNKMADDGETDTLYGSYDRIDVRGAQIRDKTEGFTSTGESRGEFFRAAQLASAELGTQILKLNYGGFDTHASQNDANPQLFTKVNDEFQQFVADLKALGLWEKTCICFYTEFGRRNEENDSPGTDHGHGGHMILAGPSVNGGLHGQRVTTADLKEKSLPYYVDFRAVFSSCIGDWLGFDPTPIFGIDGETFDTNIGSDLFV